MVLAGGLFGLLNFGSDPSLNSSIIAKNPEPAPYLQDRQQPEEPSAIYAKVDPAQMDPDTPPQEIPGQVTPPGKEDDTTYSGTIRLPAVAYSSQSDGSYSLTLLAAYADYDAARPHISPATTVNYYLKVDEEIQQWALNLSGGESPIFIQLVDKMPSASSLAGCTNLSEQYGYSYYTASSADGSTVAANCGGETPGVYLYPAADSGQAVAVSDLGGGRLISWADNNKFLFTDERGLLHVYYIAERQELLVYNNSVASASWAADSRTIVFSGYDSTSGHYNIYKVSVP